MTSYGSTRLRMDLDRMSLWQDHMGIRQLAEHYSRLTSTCFSIRHTATTTATPVPTGAHISGMFVHSVNLRHPRNNPSSSSVPSRAGASVPSSKRSASSRLWRWSSTICSSMVPFVTSL